MLKQQLTMKPQDLMVGDLISMGGVIRVVTGIHDKETENGVDLITTMIPGHTFPDSNLSFRASYCYPIPITPEILEKNGFTYCKSDGGFYLHTTISYGNWDVDVVLFDVTDEYRNNQLHISSPDDSYIAIHLMECNHVHELQHALRLCGIKKEIVL